jgi:hypothetical protein
MGKYRSLGTLFNRVFRNDLNANFNDLDTDILAAKAEALANVNAQKTRVDNLITGTPQPSEVVDARGGQATLSARLNNVDTKLNDTVNQFSDFTLAPQSPKPSKKGLLTCSPKIVQKLSDNELRIVQKTNKGYIRYMFTKNSGASGTGDYGVNHQLIRITGAYHVQDAYVYKDVSTPVTGTVTTLYSPGMYNTAESLLFYMPLLDSGNSFSSKGNGFGLGTYAIDVGTEVTYSMKVNPNGKANALFLCTPGSSDTVQISINNILVKTVNLKSYLTDGASQNAMVIVDFEVPKKAGVSENVSVKIRNNASTGSVYLGALNFFFLKDYADQDITDFKCFGSTKGGWIDNSGSSDYALYDTTAQKFFGSYHGGEVSELDQILWNNDTKIGENYLSNVSLSSITVNAWKVQKSFQIYQQTDLANGGAKMVSKFNFDIDGTIEMDFGYYNASIKLGTFYTSLTATSKDFEYIFLPRYKYFGSTPSNTYFSFLLTEGFISQNASKGLQMDIRFTKFNNEHDTRGATVFDSDAYRKFYYGPVYGQISSPVTLSDLSFSKGLDFIVR